MAATPKKPTPARATMKDMKPLPKKNGVETVKSATKNVPAIKKAITKAADKPSGIEKLVQDVTNRYRVTAREARDIVTSVSTAAKAPKFAGNVVKQVKEAASAAATGAKGDSAYVISKNGKNATKTSRKKFEEGTKTSVSTKGKLM